jgi:Ala-tRNA(Pro) deacylase
MLVSVYARIKALLDQGSVLYDELEHAPTRTSAESAAARGDRGEFGGKALLLKAGNTFRLFVLRSTLRLDVNRVKAHLGVKRVRFATAEELFQLTELVPGAVPAFGRPILPLDLFADGSITQQEHIAFNAGLLTRTITLSTEDYLRLAEPVVFPFASE